MVFVHQTQNLRESTFLLSETVACASISSCFKRTLQPTFWRLHVQYIKFHVHSNTLDAMKLSVSPRTDCFEETGVVKHLAHHELESGFIIVVMVVILIIIAIIIVVNCQLLC